MGVVLILVRSNARADDVRDLHFAMNRAWRNVSSFKAYLDGFGIRAHFVYLRRPLRLHIWGVQSDGAYVNSYYVDGYYYHKLKNAPWKRERSLPPPLLPDIMMGDGDPKHMRIDGNAVVGGRTFPAYYLTVYRMRCAVDPITYFVQSCVWLEKKREAFMTFYDYDRHANDFSLPAAALAARD